MKFRWDRKYLHWGMTAFLVICASILFYYFLFHTTSIRTGFSKFIAICMPVIDGMIIAYLLRPVLNLIENHIFRPLYAKAHIEVNNRRNRRMRGYALFFTGGFFILIIYSFFAMLIPQLITSIQSIAQQFPSYVDNLQNWIANLLKNNVEIEKISMNLIDKYSKDVQIWLNQEAMPYLNIILKEISLSVLSVAVFLWNFIIGFIISIYLLNGKEKFAGQSKKIIYALFLEENANKIVEDIRFIDRTFGGYITGSIINSIIIGVLCFFGMNVLKLPYPVLISVIVGVTNVIPFFGPYMGAIPSAILILMINPTQMFIFVIFILILQQLDGNILSPKILGDSTGLSGFWVIFSITLFGGVFGIIGMAVGVPIFAVFYAFIRRKINTMLQKKKLTLETAAYQKVEKIENGEFKKLLEFEKNSEAIEDATKDRSKKGEKKK